MNAGLTALPMGQLTFISIKLGAYFFNIVLERQSEIARKELENRVELIKKVAIIATPILTVIIILVIVFNAFILPNSKYNDAVTLMNTGKLDEAYNIFLSLNDFRDSIDKANNIRLTQKKEVIKEAKVGDCVIFGSYEQDNNTSNGFEDIEWIILDKKGEKVLVISKYAIDCKPYNECNEDITWETCSLRKWLNNDFINTAFSADEKAMIPTVTVSADKNPEYSTNSGNATKDQIFLLSIIEANKYFSSNSTRKTKPTYYAIANGTFYNNANNHCWWWLRSSGYYQENCAYTDSLGAVNTYGTGVDDNDLAVRPAMWIAL